MFKFTFLSLLLPSVGGFGFEYAPVESASVFSSPDGILYVKPGTEKVGALASGSYQGTMDALGWDSLQVDPGTEGSDLDKMFAMGFVEAYFTHPRIWNYVNNFKKNKFKPDGVPPPEVTSWVKDQWDWMREKIADSQAKPLANDADRAYWHSMAQINAQVEGLAAGYSRYADAEKPLTAFDLYLLQNSGDLSDVVSAIKGKNQRKEVTVSDEDDDDNPTPSTREGGLQASVNRLGAVKIEDVPPASEGTLAKLACSALVRLMPGGRSAAVAHNTWRNFSGMQRIYKRYTYPNGQTITLTSSPGFVHSKDDWYVQENKGKLVIMETTNGNYNKDLYAYLAHSPQARKVAMSWQRAMASCMLAETAQEWVDTVMKHNSGTYNNQWIVLDSKKLSEGSKKDVLWIGEQSVQYHKNADVSDVLFEKGFWKSYNIPYFPEIYRLHNYNANDKESSHELCTRSQIMERDAPKITSREDMMEFIRYNDYKHDPESHECARLSIASRYDLSSEKACGARAKPLGFGAVDAKVVLSDSLHRVEAISGPPHSVSRGIAPFDWRDFKGDAVARDGIPLRYEFPWVTFTTESNLNSDVLSGRVASVESEMEHMAL